MTTRQLTFFHLKSLDSVNKYNYLNCYLVISLLSNLVLRVISHCPSKWIWMKSLHPSKRLPKPLKLIPKASKITLKDFLARVTTFYLNPFWQAVAYEYMVVKMSVIGKISQTLAIQSAFDKNCFKSILSVLFCPFLRIKLSNGWYQKLKDQPLPKKYCAIWQISESKTSCVWDEN